MTNPRDPTCPAGDMHLGLGSGSCSTAGCKINLETTFHLYWMLRFGSRLVNETSGRDFRVLVGS